MSHPVRRLNFDVSQQVKSNSLKQTRTSSVTSELVNFPTNLRPTETDGQIFAFRTGQGLWQFTLLGSTKDDHRPR